MRSKQNHQTRDIDNLKRQNSHLEAQIKALERAKNSGQYHSSTEILESQGLNYDPSDTELPIGSEASSGSMGRASMGDGGSGSDTDSGKECFIYIYM